MATKKDGDKKPKSSSTSILKIKSSKPKKIGMMPSSNYSEPKKKLSVDISGGASLGGRGNKSFTVGGNVDLPVVKKKKYSLSLTASGGGGGELGRNNKNRGGSINPGLSANISLGGNKKKTIKKPF